MKGLKKRSLTLIMLIELMAMWTLEFVVSLFRLDGKLELARNEAAIQENALNKDHRCVMSRLLAVLGILL